jgi:hypothetical protein
VPPTSLLCHTGYMAPQNLLNVGTGREHMPEEACKKEMHQLCHDLLDDDGHPDIVKIDDEFYHIDTDGSGYLRYAYFRRFLEKKPPYTERRQRSSLSI